MSVSLASDELDALIEHLGGGFYVPIDAAREAVRTRSSLGLLDRAIAEAAMTG